MCLASAAVTHDNQCATSCCINLQWLLGQSQFTSCCARSILQECEQPKFTAAAWMTAAQHQNADEEGPAMERQLLCNARGARAGCASATTMILLMAVLQSCQGIKWRHACEAGKGRLPHSHLRARPCSCRRCREQQLVRGDPSRLRQLPRRHGQVNGVAGRGLHVAQPAPPL